MRIEVRRAARPELPQLEKFWAELYAEQHRTECRSGTELIHQVFLNPFSQDGGTAWMAWADGRAVGHLNASTCPAYSKGTEIPSCWWQGFYVLESLGVLKTDAAVKLAFTVAKQPMAQVQLGIGDQGEKAFQLYRGMKFRYWGAVPFFFQILHGARVLRELQILQRRRVSKWLAQVGSRLFLPGKLVELSMRRAPARHASLATELWRTFPRDADELWNRTRPEYDVVFDRSSAWLNWRYASDAYLRIGVRKNRELIGWAVCKATAMKDNPHFGTLQVGTIVDVYCQKHEPAIREVLGAARDVLVSEAVDLIVTNFSHRDYIAAIRSLGFARGPSNFQLLSKGLPDVSLDAVHITRGDSDGDGRL